MMKKTNEITTDWNGYAREDFKLDQYDCILVIPSEVYPGAPWVWRAEFFGAFDYVDKELLKRGWHIAYIRISDMYGCPEAIDVMEQFYEYMTKEAGLSKKVDLFGFSRGGLYSVNYAVRNPDTISTLYLDAPVLDVTSWPGGYGSADRCEKEWKECKEVYKLTDETALMFKQNPIDKMDQLLDSKIKIMLVAGAADSDVPYAENGKRLAEYYMGNGGDLRVILKPECAHHPHSLEDPTPVVEYIMKNFSGI